MLDASSIRLQTDHLDVWQIYEVIYHNDEVEALRAESDPAVSGERSSAGSGRYPTSDRAGT
jgi:hypothetical protein